MIYCASRHSDGWYCLLTEGHLDDHMSIDNSRLWKGTPGAPVFWPAERELTREQTDELDPMLTQGEIAKARAKPAAPAPTKAAPKPKPKPKGILVGDICGICGQPSIIRESSCRTRCKSCGAIEGGCG